MPDMLNNGEGPQAREPSKCPNGLSNRERLVKRPSECQLQEARKKTLIGPELLGRRQSASRHTWRRQGPRKPSSCATFTINCHWSRAATGKKMSCIYVHGVALVKSNSLQPYRLWSARLLGQGGGSPGKNTGVNWPILFAIPF